MIFTLPKNNSKLYLAELIGFFMDWNSVPPSKDMLEILTSSTVRTTLFGNRFFVDIMKLILSPIQGRGCQSHDWCLCENKDPNTGTQGECPVMTVAEIKAILYRPKYTNDCQQHQKLRKEWNRLFLDPSERFCWHCDFRLLAFRTVREQISVVLGCLGCGNSYGSTGKLIHPLM